MEIYDTVRFNDIDKSSLEKNKIFRIKNSAVDHIYGISYDYIKYWENKIQKKIHFFDPMQFLNLNQVFNNIEKKILKK